MLITDAYRKQNRAVHASSEHACDVRLARPMQRPDAWYDSVEMSRQEWAGEWGPALASVRERLMQACA